MPVITWIDFATHKIHEVLPLKLAYPVTRLVARILYRFANKEEKEKLSFMQNR